MMIVCVFFFVLPGPSQDHLLPNIQLVLISAYQIIYQVPVIVAYMANRMKSKKMTRSIAEAVIIQWLLAMCLIIVIASFANWAGVIFQRFGCAVIFCTGNVLAHSFDINLSLYIYI